MGVGGVGLAALAGGEDPHPRRHFRRHVHDVLIVGDEAVGDVLADPGTALDRPGPLRPLAGISQQSGIPIGVGAEPPAANDRLATTTVMSSWEGTATYGWAYPS